MIFETGPLNKRTASVHYLERLYDFWKEAPNLMEVNSLLWASMNWPRFWAAQILLITLMFM
ncbi:hypothetical protein [Pseudomonas retamae]|uniref:Uncharacterized protein n=1 Tax=Pseudomonas retamae TaxID=702110 RepID=A0ABW7D5D0_9PSED